MTDPSARPAPPRPDLPSTAIHAGTLWPRADGVDGVDVVLVTEVTVEARRAGASTVVRRLEIPRLRRWQRAHRDVHGVAMPVWCMRLARRTRHHRAELDSRRDSGLRWFDDGRSCHVTVVTGDAGNAY
ncbi:MAG: hypothetical protein ACR2JQ_07905 [Mycobacteriales bacterium]